MTIIMAGRGQGKTINEDILFFTEDGFIRKD